MARFDRMAQDELDEVALKESFSERPKAGWHMYNAACECDRCMRETTLQLAVEVGRQEVIGLVRQLRDMLIPDSQMAMALTTAIEEVEARLYPARSARQNGKV